MNNQTTRRSWSIGSLLRDVGEAWRLFRDPRVPGLMKLLLPVAAVIYFISPLDLMPGLPFDDIAVLVLALRFFVQIAEQMQGVGAQQRAGDDEHSAHSATGQTIETSWRVVDE